MSFVRNAATVILHDRDQQLQHGITEQQLQQIDQQKGRGNATLATPETSDGGANLLLLLVGGVVVVGVVWWLLSAKSKL